LAAGGGGGAAFFFFSSSICAGVGAGGAACAYNGALSFEPICAAADGASDVAAKAGVTAKAAPTAVQANKSDLIEFIVEILRMGALFVYRARLV
jgi:hypothetical protein